VYDVFWAGFGGISFLNTFFEHVNDVERVIIFIIFLIMSVIRIINLLQKNSEKKEDIIKKRQDNEAHRIEIENMRNPPDNGRQRKTK